MASTKPASPDYFKSRLGTFLNPMFLFALIILGIVGIVAWQILVINSKFQESPSNGRANIDEATPELQELLQQDRLEETSATESLEGEIENQTVENAVSEPTSNQTEENPYAIEDQIRTGDLADILGRDPLGIRQQNENQGAGRGLYHQILSLPRISPTITPSNGSGFSRGLLAIDPPSTRRPSQASNNNMGISPLNEAVGNVMSRNNNNTAINSYQGGYQYNAPSPQGYVNVNPNTNQSSGSSVNSFNPSMGVNNINAGFAGGQVYQPPQQNQTPTNQTPTTQSPF